MRADRRTVAEHLHRHRDTLQPHVRAPVCGVIHAGDRYISWLWAPSVLQSAGRTVRYIDDWGHPPLQPFGIDDDESLEADSLRGACARPAPGRTNLLGALEMPAGSDPDQHDVGIKIPSDRPANARRRWRTNEVESSTSGAVAQSATGTATRRACGTAASGATPTGTGAALHTTGNVVPAAVPIMGAHRPKRQLSRQEKAALAEASIFDEPSHGGRPGIYSNNK